MIDLTRLNGNRFVVNCDLIQYAESSPDTMLSLVTGEKLLVRESCDTVIDRILDYRASVLSRAWPEATAAIAARAAASYAKQRAADHDE